MKKRINTVCLCNFDVYILLMNKMMASIFHLFLTLIDCALWGISKIELKTSICILRIYIFISHNIGKKDFNFCIYLDLLSITFNFHDYHAISNTTLLLQLIYNLSMSSALDRGRRSYGTLYQYHYLYR